jgi:hypothetical protein
LEINDTADLEKKKERKGAEESKYQRIGQGNETRA